MKPQSIILLALALLVVLSAPLYSQDAAVMKNGKAASITVFEPAQVGGVTLKPGEYVVQHRVDGEQHIMRFRPKSGKGADTTAPVVCEMTEDAWTRTEARYKDDGGVRKLARITIAGEKVTYLFD